MSKYCRFCGQENPDRARFCGKCGKPMGAVEPPPRGNPEGPAGMRRVEPVNKALMLPLSLIIGTAALAIIAWIIQFVPSDIQMYEEKLLAFAGKYTGPDATEDLLRKVAACVVWTAIAGIVSTAYMVPLRVTRVLRNTVGLADRFVIVIMVYFVVAPGGLLITYVQDDEFKKLFANLARVQKGERLIYILLLLVVVALIGFVVWLVVRNALGLGKLFTQNIRVNGPFGGTISALYDIFSSIFIVAAVVMVACFGIALVIFPFILLAAAMSGGRRVVCIDGVYYYVE